MIEQSEQIIVEANAVGIDEVGYGAWAGPVVVCALQFFKIPEKQFFDSKQLSEKKREELCEYIKTCAKWKIGVGSIEMINASSLGAAHKYAILEAAQEFKDAPIYIDGRTVKFIKCTGITKGDQKIQVISAASIMAKVFRDNLMKQLNNEYPDYNWAKNKGYGTKEHADAIVRLGFSPMHRINYQYKFL